MKHPLRKILALIMSLVMLCSLLLPVSAADKIDPTKLKSQVPIVYILGDSGKMIDKNGKEIALYSYLPFVGDSNSSAGEVFKSMANVLMPFLIEGLTFDNWEPYYENLQKEMSDLFGDMMLDENGEASNGTYPAGLDFNENAKKTDKKQGKGYYDIGDYKFYYDWRLDPSYIADQLKEYIDAVKKVTGHEKIALYSSCLGVNVAFAYVQKYGTDDLYGFGISSSVALGVTTLSEFLTGKFSLDGAATARTLADLLPATKGSIVEFLCATLDLAEKSGVFDAISGVTKATLYDKLVKGVTSAMTLGTVINFPCYWACVSEEDFDEAVNMVFGNPGSEKYQKYEKLIEKITAYNNNVKKNIPKMLADIAADENIRLAVVVKYGFQLLPLSKSRDKVADTFVTVEKASFGATASTIYEPLSDEYIASRVEAGFGKYISPDRQIDASTGICPDYTWYAKNVPHIQSSDGEKSIIGTVITSEKRLTVDDLTIGQFAVTKDPNNINVLETMTEENCHTEKWTANEKEDKPQTFIERLRSYFKSLFRWIKAYFSFVGNLFNKKK